jgi:glyoxylase-like metal-dependent hydrolase (beta-lactamase superfamily II)
LSLEVTTFVNGRWRENCYIVTNSAGDALVIDPGSQAQDIIGILDEKGCRMHGILNTHGHYDHVGGVAPLEERYRVPFYLHNADHLLLRRANLYRVMFECQDTVRIPKTVNDVSALPASFELGGFEVDWIGTPGHTEGSVCFRIGQYLFSGDTLLRGAVGRTDLPGGNREQLKRSVRKLRELPGDLVVCAGHGARTTLAAEFSPGGQAQALCDDGD